MVIMVKLHLFENESDHPEKSEDDVFGHGKVVEDGAKGFILIIILIWMMKKWSFFSNDHNDDYDDDDEDVRPWINCFLPEQRILSSIGSKESPIHPWI